MIPVSYEAVGLRYPGGSLALDGVTLEVDAGELVVVVGSSGSGKSTLLRTTNGLVPHASGGAFRGDVRVDGRSIREHRPREMADLVGFVHQDPEAHFVVDRVEGDVAFSLENLGMDPAAMRRRVEEVLDALGVAHLRHRSPTTLSGGERQRVAIAGALAASPPVLVLDEPTSELDPQGAEDVLAAVQRLNLDLGTTVVLAEHRLERVAHLVDRVVVLERGRVAVEGPPGEVLGEYPGAPPVSHLGRLLGWSPVPLSVRDARVCARGFELPAPPETGRSSAGEPLLVLDGLGVSYDRPALRGVDLTIRRGEVWALLGRNGSGKTTLLRCAAGLLEPDRGRVDRLAPVSYLPQDPNSLLFAPTVRSELEETLRLRGLRDDGRVERWLERLGLSGLEQHHPRSLSAGERQRVAVATIAVGGADPLLLDEPTRGIDAASRDALERAISEHAAGGGAVVVATHDVELAARVADQVLVLGEGEAMAQGAARSVLSGSLFAPQVLRVLPPFMTVEEVAEALEVR